jgi:DNA polymerase
MARGYGVRVSDPEAERIRDRWREANPWAREFWNAIDGAVAMSMKHPVTPFSAGRLMYVYRPDFFEGMGALFCLLPSARLLCYPMPRYDVVKRKFPDGSTKEQRVLTAVKGSRKPGQTESEWPRSNLWFGLLAENATQAVAGQVLRDTLMRVRDLPYYLDVVAHTHDEVVTEVDEDDDKAEADLLHAMTTVEGWAEGLPLAAEISSGVRYGK